MPQTNEALANALIGWVEPENMMCSEIFWASPALRTEHHAGGPHAAQRAAALDAELDDWRAEMRRRDFRGKGHGAGLGQRVTGWRDQLGELCVEHCCEDRAARAAGPR